MEPRAERRISNFAHAHLVHAPVANSEVSSLKENAEVVRQLRQSDFYMIGARPSAKFIGISASGDKGDIAFTIEVPGMPADTGILVVNTLVADVDLEFEGIAVKMNATLLWLELLNNGEAVGTIAFTPDRLLMERGRHTRWIRGLDRARELATYDLLYVGIATATDSYSRLIAKGHEARVKILSDEPQRAPGARVTDEIMLFMFRIEAMGLTIIGAEGIAENDDFDMTIPPNDNIVKDAEKAFVSLLLPHYNEQKYRNYPAGKDGLYHLGLTNYSYTIAEGIQFCTPYGTFKGAREREMPMSNEADFILVEGDEVTIHISGVDFPSKHPFTSSTDIEGETTD